MKNDKEKMYLIAAAVLVALSVIIAAVGFSHRKKAEAAVGGKTGTQIEKLDKDKILNKKIFQTEMEIDCQVIEDGLTKMGTLITAKYYFKDIVSIDKIHAWSLLNAHAQVMFEGYVPAGIDFSQIRVSVDKERKEVCVKVPKAEIMDVFIDHDSVQVVNEKDNFINKFEGEDFFDGEKELAEKSKQDAIKKGLLKDADANAEALIFNFVTSFTSETGYKTVIVR